MNMDILVSLLYLLTNMLNFRGLYSLICGGKWSFVDPINGEVKLKLAISIRFRIFCFSEFVSKH